MTVHAVEFGPLADVLRPDFTQASRTVNGRSVRPKAARIPREMRPGVTAAGAACRPGTPDLVPVEYPGDEVLALAFTTNAAKWLPEGHPALKHLAAAALALSLPEPTHGGAA